MWLRSVNHVDGPSAAVCSAILRLPNLDWSKRPGIAAPSAPGTQGSWPAAGASVVTWSIRSWATSRSLRCSVWEIRRRWSNAASGPHFRSPITMPLAMSITARDVIASPRFIAATCARALGPRRRRACLTASPTSRLAPRDTRVEVVTFGVPRAGPSPTAWLPNNFPLLGRFLVRLLDQLGYNRFDILGISWGGALAQHVAFQHPRRCRQLVLVSTAAVRPLTRDDDGGTASEDHETTGDRSSRPRPERGLSAPNARTGPRTSFGASPASTPPGALPVADADLATSRLWRAAGAVSPASHRPRNRSAGLTVDACRLTDHSRLP